MTKPTHRFTTILSRGLILGCALAALGLAPQALAQDPSVAGGKITVCLTCHGATGKSNNAIYPHIAGQHAEYLVKAMKAYRDGGRQDPLMTPMAVGLTDREIEELANYYASQQP